MSKINGIYAATMSVLNSNLIDRISRNDGADGLMPQGGPRLSQDLINIIIQWELDALLEN